MNAAAELSAVLVEAINRASIEKANPAEQQTEMIVAGLKFLLGKIEQLEALPMEYAGTYWPDKEYRKRQFVTCGGRVWACVADATRDKPGLSSDWKLAVDKGRDGKDAK